MNQKAVLSPEFIQRLKNYSKEYEQKERVLKQLEMEIQDFVERNANAYTDINPIVWMEIINYFPLCYLRTKLEKQLERLLDERKAEDMERKTQVLPSQVKQKLVVFSKQHGNASKEMFDVNDAMDKEIWNYLRKHRLRDDPKTLLNIISYLPGCYCRFRLYERYYKLEDDKIKDCAKGKDSRKAEKSR